LAFTKLRDFRVLGVLGRLLFGSGRVFCWVVGVFAYLPTSWLLIKKSSPADVPKLKATSRKPQELTPPQGFLTGWDAHYQRGSSLWPPYFQSVTRACLGYKKEKAFCSGS
jgi:hypothetical protein